MVEKFIKAWLTTKRRMCDKMQINQLWIDLFENLQYNEADINYNGGFRNRQRILYSNDGLIFVSYDHYQTFYEITN